MGGKNPFLKKATGTQKAPVRVEKKHGLGRGLDSLIPSKTAVQAAPLKPLAPVKPVAAVAPAAPLEIPILDIERSPFQPRLDFKDDELKELAESLKNNGLVHPPAVRKNSAGKYELISGERRLRAALLAG